MPYKCERPGALIRPDDDRRRKLSEEQKENIRELYKLPDWSQRRLAGEFGVSRRLIQFIVDPEKEAAAKQGRAELAKDGRYYDRIKHNEQMRRHREHKNELDKQGKLSDTES